MIPSIAAIAVPAKGIVLVISDATSPILLNTAEAILNP